MNDKFRAWLDGHERFVDAVLSFAHGIVYFVGAFAVSAWIGNKLQPVIGFFAWLLMFAVLILLGVLFAVHMIRQDRQYIKAMQKGAETADEALRKENRRLKRQMEQ